MNVLSLVCREPNDIWIDFLNTFHSYKVFIVINNNDYVIPEKYLLENKITFVKIDDETCYNSGFNHANRCASLSYFPEITAWDKALYYFSHINSHYDNIWFIEDDCFFIHENTIKNIDNKYINQDLLTKNNYINYEESPTGWHWESVTDLILPPRACSVIQACRLSKKLIEKINNYASINKRLIMIEVMFNTLAFQNNFLIECPLELSKLECMNYDTISNVDDIHIYHGLKDINMHKRIRDLYNNNSSLEM